MLTADGEYIGQWGEFGDGPGQFNMPFGIETDQDGNVYVADWRNDRIQKFTADGKFLMQFGATGDGPGQFNRPTDVAVDNEGSIYVADWNNERMQIFHPDGSYAGMTYGEGTISTWGKGKIDANPEMWEERRIAQGLDRERAVLGPDCRGVRRRGPHLRGGDGALPGSRCSTSWTRSSTGSTSGWPAAADDCKPDRCDAAGGGGCTASPTRMFGRPRSA